MDNFILLRASFMVKIGCALPLLSMVTCVLTSIFLVWDGATETHCQVANYLPSISAAIGEFTPQKYIWRIGIALHSGPRFLSALINFCLHKQLSFAKGELGGLIKFNLILQIIEILSLVALSYVSSSENFDIHKSAFITFIATSTLYMFTCCFLLHSLIDPQRHKYLRYSLRIKMKIAAIYIFMLLLSFYFYFRHQKYCEPGVYSLFALCEYSIVTLNIAFHGTYVYDWRNACLTLAQLFDDIETSSGKVR